MSCSKAFTPASGRALLRGRRWQHCPEREEAQQFRPFQASLRGHKTAVQLPVSCKLFSQNCMKRAETGRIGIVHRIIMYRIYSECGCTHRRPAKFCRMHEKKEGGQAFDFQSLFNSVRGISGFQFRKESFLFFLAPTILFQKHASTCM